MRKTAPAPQPLPEPLIELVAQRFRVLGEPMWIKLLDRLREVDGHRRRAPGSARRLPANVSKHLGILHAAGMVSRTKDGNHTRYAISDPSMFELCDQVCGGVRRQLKASRRSSRQADPAARCHHRRGQPVRATFNPAPFALRTRRPRAHVARRAALAPGSRCPTRIHLLRATAPLDSSGRSERVGRPLPARR